MKKLVAVIAILAAGAAFAAFMFWEPKSTYSVGATDMAHVDAVVDGGTLIISNAVVQSVTVKLADVNIPSLQEPNGAKAHASLTDLSWGRETAITIKGKANDGSWLVDMSVDGAQLAQEQVRRGWATPANAQDPKYEDAQSAAKSAGLGMWAAASPDAVEKPVQ